jgi:hypothetical protein
MTELPALALKAASGIAPRPIGNLPRCVAGRTNQHQARIMTDRKKPDTPHLRVVTGGSKKPPSRAKATAKAGDGGKGGRPPHQPSPQTKALVSVCKAIGYTDEQIAATVEISPTTLKLHYKEELETGAAKVNAKVAANLFATAVSTTHPKAITAAIFWAKARMGWSDKTPEAEEGDDETPVEFTIGIGEKRGA